MSLFQAPSDSAGRSPHFAQPHEPLALHRALGEGRVACPMSSGVAPGTSSAAWVLSLQLALAEEALAHLLCALWTMVRLSLLICGDGAVRPCLSWREPRVCAVLCVVPGREVDYCFQAAVLHSLSGPCLEILDSALCCGLFAGASRSVFPSCCLELWGLKNTLVSLSPLAREDSLGGRWQEDLRCRGRWVGLQTARCGRMVRCPSSAC